MTEKQLAPIMRKALWYLIGGLLGALFWLGVLILAVRLWHGN